MRLCTKTACPNAAVASCAFNYADRLVWISPLHRDPDPSHYDLCQEHAHALRVPKGWSLDDRRDVTREFPLLEHARAVEGQHTFG